MANPQSKLDSMKVERTVKFNAPGGSKQDLLVVCGVFNFLVHEKVLVEKCKFFEKAMSVDMKEKRERKIIIEEKDAFVVQALLFYLYHAHYDDNRGNEPEHDLQLTFNVKVYYLAEEYQMDVLKIRARERFEAALKKPQNLADSDIRAAIDLIYNTLGDQDKKLQEALTKLSTEGFGKLSTRPGFKSAMQEIPGFGSDVAFKLAKVTRKYTCTACSSCVASATHLKLSKAWCEKCRTVKTDQLLTQTEFVSV